MNRFGFYAVVIFLCFIFSCIRGEKNTGSTNTSDSQAQKQANLPTAILQAGEYPLWFLITSGGPVHIETVEDALFSAALIPWPFAPHIRFILARADDLFFAVNRSGLIRFSPEAQIAQEYGTEAVTEIYYFFGGEYWGQYTVGGFFLFNEKPAALLYRDDRFLDSDIPPPKFRLWTYNPNSFELDVLGVPALDVFTPEDGWNIDTFRLNGVSRYFRAVKKNSAHPETRLEVIMRRTKDLFETGEQISLGLFQNSARPEPVSAAPEPLRDILAMVFQENAGRQAGSLTIVSPEPEFPALRCFAGSSENDQELYGYFLKSLPEFQTPYLKSQTPILIIIDPQGNGLYIQEETAAINRFSLPPLPEGYVYTGIGLAGNTVIASWEEQEGYSIGASGFMALHLAALMN